jgi:hypothetical protein
MRVIRAPQRIAVLGAVLGMFSMLWLPGVASAGQTDPGDGGGNSPQGYTVEVAIRFSGDAAPGGGGVRRVRVAPTCWWLPASGPYTDAVAMLAWYDEVTGGAQTRGIISLYGPRKVWKDAAEQEKSGAADLSWYRAFCKDPAQIPTYGGGVDQGSDGPLGDPTTWVTYPYQTFNVGQPIPQPRVDPAELARAARDEMVIPVPETNRNPKIHAAGAPTLVGLPTWFWVTNPVAVGVGNDRGTRRIRAEINAPQLIWAEVTAATGGLSLQSPAGSATCIPARARTAYADGVPETRGCTVQFAKASVGYPDGYPVTASTAWTATWDGSDGTQNEQLDGLTRTVTTQVPVAEVQNIVTH